MNPDFDSTERKKLKYILERNEEGIDVITADPASEVTYIDPLKGTIPAKQLRNSTDKEFMVSTPHQALSRIDLTNTSDIIEFVNDWGLLDLRKVEKYQKAESLNLIDLKPSLYDGSYSTVFENRRKSGFKRWQEPLKLFIEAAEEYQNFVKSLTAIKSTNEVDLGTQLLFNSMLKGCQPTVHFNDGEWVSSWSYRSLLHAIYLRTYLDIHKIKLCQNPNCQKIFLSTNPEAKTCSLDCRTSKNTYYSRLNTTLNKIKDKYPNKDPIWLEEQFAILTSEGISGEKRLIKQMERKILILTNKGERLL